MPRPRDVANGGSKIVLDLGEVNYVDSSGVGELVRTFTAFTGEGKQLKLLNLTKKVREVMVITKLLIVFETFETEQSAVASFKGALPASSSDKAAAGAWQVAQFPRVR